MKIKLVILIGSLLTTCCSYNERNNNQVKSDSLVNIKKDSLLFLSFWHKMSEQEFNSIIDIENRKGNLHNGLYYFFIENGKDSVGFKLGQTSDGKGIELNYKNEYRVKGDKSRSPMIPLWEFTNYKQIKNSLINHFDNKYIRLDSSRMTIRHLFNVDRWQVNDEFQKVIEFQWTYRIENQSNTFWRFNPKTSEYSLADCNFNIRILSLQDYQRQTQENLESERTKKAREEEERRTKELNAKEKNSKL